MDTQGSKAWIFRKNIHQPSERYYSEQELADLAKQLSETLQTFKHTQNYVFQIEYLADNIQEFLHFQGYLELTEPITKHDLINMFHPTTFSFLAKNRGSTQQAWNYCAKPKGRVLGPWHYRSPTTRPF
jgi:hypothetical protein